MERDFWPKLAPAPLTVREIPEDCCLGRLWEEQGGGKEAISSTNSKACLSSCFGCRVQQLWGLLARFLLHDRKGNCQSQRETPARVALRFVLCVEMLLSLVGFTPWYGERDLAAHNCLLGGMTVLWTLVGLEITFWIQNKCSFSDWSVYLITVRKVCPKCQDQVCFSEAVVRTSHYIRPTLNILEGRSDIILICKVVCSVY